MSCCDNDYQIDPAFWRSLLKSSCCDHDLHIVPAFWRRPCHCRDHDCHSDNVDPAYWRSLLKSSCCDHDYIVHAFWRSLWNSSCCDHDLHIVPAFWRRPCHCRDHDCHSDNVDPAYWRSLLKSSCCDHDYIVHAFWRSLWNSSCCDHDLHIVPAFWRRPCQCCDHYFQIVPAFWRSHFLLISRCSWCDQDYSAHLHFWSNGCLDHFWRSLFYVFYLGVSVSRGQLVGHSDSAD